MAPETTVLAPNGEIRLAMLHAAQIGQTTADIAQAVEVRTGWQCTPRQAGNMLSRLHRAGWLTYVGYNTPRGPFHSTTAAGREVLRLIEVER